MFAKKLIFIYAALFLSAGCAALKGTQVPPGTSAGYNLRTKVAHTIDAQQKIYDPDCKTYTITDARVAGSKDLTVLEEWRVLACAQVTVYDVQIIHTPYGGTTYNVTRRE